MNDFLHKRLVFLANGGSAESFHPEGMEGGGGVSEQAREQAAEDRRQAAAAAKKQHGDEKKSRRRDRRLAEILQFFLKGSSRDDRLVALITHLLRRNTPPAVILAVLSLNYSDVKGVLEDYLEEERDMVPDHAPEYSYQADPQALVPFGQELAVTLSEWTRRIFIHGSFLPMKTVMALAAHHGVDHAMIDLSQLIIQRFFKESGKEVPLDNIRQFVELFWKDLLKKLHKIASERGLLPNPKVEMPKTVEEDW